MPNIPDRAILEFSPVNLPKKNIGLWLTDIGQGEYLGLKESADGQILYTAVPKVTNQAFDTLLDSYIVEVDNCFGTAIREDDHEVSRTETSTILTRADLEWKGLPVDIAILSGVPFLKTVIDTAIRSFLTTYKYEHNEGESITYSTVHKLTAAPHTWTRYRVNIYSVSIQGIVTLTIGDHRLEIPFDVAQRIRSEAISLIPGMCTMLTPSTMPTAPATP